MTYLLDSHVLLWWLGNQPRLNPAHRSILENVRNKVVVSSISIAELEINASLGKLEMPDDLPGAIAAVGLDELAFEARHATALRDLPFHHRDPFDRMLVAQAIVDDLIFLTDDDNCKKYDIVTR